MAAPTKVDFLQQTSIIFVFFMKWLKMRRARRLKRNMYFLKHCMNKNRMKRSDLDIFKWHKLNSNHMNLLDNLILECNNNFISYLKVANEIKATERQSCLVKSTSRSTDFVDSKSSQFVESRATQLAEPRATEFGNATSRNRSNQLSDSKSTQFTGISSTSRSTQFADNLLEDRWIEEDYVENMRVSKSMFYELCRVLGSRLKSYDDDNCRKSIPVTLKMAVSLYYLADRCSCRTVANLFGLEDEETVLQCLQQLSECVDKQLAVKSFPAPIWKFMTKLANNLKNRIPMAKYDW
ncbi:hypothetical protein CHUAL_007916 [Chamberlinius hualienensis]